MVMDFLHGYVWFCLRYITGLYRVCTLIPGQSCFGRYEATERSVNAPFGILSVLFRIMSCLNRFPHFTSAYASSSTFVWLSSNNPLNWTCSVSGVCIWARSCSLLFCQVGFPDLTHCSHSLIFQLVCLGSHRKSCVCRNAIQFRFSIAHLGATSGHFRLALWKFWWWTAPSW